VNVLDAKSGIYPMRWIFNETCI